jgi:ABC-type transport system involved in multi-copper enzyme maturation permease subunit
MNGSVFWRLVWKEYRLQRAFWISMAVLTVLVELLVLAFVRAGPERVTWLFAIGLGLPAFYALGCGATLFATEHEAGTYGFQRALPVSAIGLFGSKLVFALGSTLAMIALLWSLAALMAGWHLPRPEGHLALWGLWGLASLELLVWGVFFSLLSTRPLKAAILGAVAASLSTQCAVSALGPLYNVDPYLAAVPYRVAIGAVVALLDVLLGYGWFREVDGVSGALEHLRRLGVIARRHWALLVLLLLPLLAVLANWPWFATARYPIALAGCLWCFTSVEVLVWAMFVSLLLRRSLNLAILVLALVSFVVHVAGAGTMPLERALLIHTLYHSVLPLRAPMVAVVALADLWLAYRRRGETTVRARPVAQTLPAAELPRRTALGRLLWHQWRQSVRMMAALSVLLVPLLLTVVSQWGQRGQVDELRIAVVAVLALAGVPLMGACVFLADQRGHGFRFFAERGIRPGHVWLSRHLVWMAVLFCWTLLVFMTTLAFLDPPAREPQHAVVILGYVFGLAILGYTAGQLCSMFLRSGILAGFFSLVLSGVLCGWAWLMWFLQVPWTWSVVPIPLALLLATWLRAGGWLLERDTLRAWLGPILALMVPAVAVLTAVPAYRVYQIPAVDPGFSPEEFARPATAEERETFQMYYRASLMYVPREAPKRAPDVASESAPPESEAERTARDAAWIKANQEAIGLMLTASRRPTCDFFDPLSDPSKAEVLQRCRFLCDALVASAAQLESEGKLDATWERYEAAVRVSLHFRHRGAWMGPGVADRVEGNVYGRLPTWAAQPGQTPQRIEAAIRQLAKLAEHVPSRSEAIKSDYLRTRRVISSGPAAFAQEIDRTRPRFWATLAMQRLPWERARALRILNLMTARDLKSFSEVESAISREASFVLPDDFRDDPEWLAMMRPTPLLAALHYWFHYGGRSWACTRDLASIETRRRAVRLLLALEARKIEHGELPKKLDELTPSYLDRLPADPYSAEQFQYFPQGLPIPITSAPWDGGEPEVIRAHTPLIWSTSESVIVKDAGEGIPDRYRIVTGRGTSRRPTSEYDVWASGWSFPLP